MKKYITFAVCLLLVLALTAAPVLAAEFVSVTATPDRSSVSGGDTVKITVSAEVDSCQQGGIEISFDSAVFELVSGKCILSDADIDYFDPATKDGAFAFGNGSAISGGVFEFTMKVKESAVAGSYKITVTFTADSVSKTTTAALTIACTHSYDNGCDTACNLCGAKREAQHKYDTGKVTTAATCTKDGVKTYTCTVCGAATTEAISKTGHSYDSGKVTTAATCTAEGVKTYTCAGCGDTKTEKIAKKDHTSDGGKVTLEPTCTEAGVKTYSCSNCGAVLDTQSLEKTGHDYKSQVTKEATCQEQGQKTVTCQVCGHYYVDDIPKADHDYASEVTFATSCREEGLETFSCKVCGHTYTQPIPKDDHKYDYECDPDCNVCGETRAVEHIYNQPWSYDETGHWHECGTCGDVLELIPHTPGPEATEEEDQICLDCGFVLQEAGVHVHVESGDWLSDENEHWRLCACGEIMAKEAHSWVLNQVDEEAGVEVYLCLICGLTEERELPPQTQPSAPETDPGQTDPSETEPRQPQTTPSADPTEPGGDNPGGDENGFPWWAVFLGGGALLLGAALFVIVGIVKSKKQVGKYSA